MQLYSIPIEIRFRDIDMNHHVNNAVYFTYMENARLAVLMEELVKYHNEDIHFVISEATCKYKRPIKLSDQLECEVSFVPLRPTSCKIKYLFKNVQSGVLYAEGSTQMVLFNANTGRPLPIPEWFTKKYLE